MKRCAHLVTTLSLLAAGSMAWTGCGSDVSEVGANSADITSSQCQILDVKTGRSMTQADLAKLNDPIAKFVLAGEGCPSDFQAISAKLRKTDVESCADDPSAPPQGTKTRLVSERSQVMGAPQSYRAVISRACGGREEHELLLSSFGVSPNAAALPGEVEAIGADPDSHTFNFYAREEGKWKFFGNSLDLIADGYECKDGACTPKAAGERRCASCHVGGGLVMKELNTPWVHWEGDTTTPGAKELVEKHKMTLGDKADGRELEHVIAKGNQAYNANRIQFLKSKGVAELLRPLFCTLDVNLQSTNDSVLAMGPLFVSFDYFIDPAWSVFDSVAIPRADYDALTTQFKQRIVDARGTQLKGLNNTPVTDTFFAFTYPERGGLNVDYVQQLVSANVVDDEFVKDALFVDFTRPIFSSARCGLLDHAPTLGAEEVGPDAIRSGFVQKLAGVSDPAATAFLASLQQSGDAAQHREAVSKFMQACKARPGKELASDMLTYASHLRRRMRGLTANSGQGVIEFSETMATDDIADTTKAFDPETCILK